ncbi:MAG TPA: signal peptidase II [Candidatus Eisenbacteria bacterium]|nr:signal peptidase II [Candidatus Eisenbacteria bacterium]
MVTGAEPSAAVQNAGRLLFALLAVLVFVADRATKLAVTANVASGTERRVLPFVWITNTHNAGAAFGVAQEGTLLLLFVVGSIAVAIGLVYYVARTPVTAAVGALLGLIMGGTVGNGYERLLNGTVTDFIALHFWPVFNVADSAITVGVVLLLAGYLVRSRRAG